MSQPSRGTHGCSLWKGICAGWESFSSHVTFEVGVGTQIHFWHDRWCGNLSLKDVFSDLFSCTIDKDALVTLALVSHSGGDGEVGKCSF